MFIKVALSVLILLISNCAEKRSNFYVFNNDTETIDSLHIFVGDRRYLLEDIQSRKSKSLKISQLEGHKIALQADTGKVMTQNSDLKPPFRGTIKFIITKEQIVSSFNYN